MSEQELPTRQGMFKSLTRIVQRAELARGVRLSLDELDIPLEDVDLDLVDSVTLPDKYRGIIALHLAGLSHADIARVTGQSASTVVYALRHKAAQPLLQKGYEIIERDAQSLFAPAVEAIRDALNTDNHSTALKASELALKVIGRLTPKDDGKVATAEDIIARMLEIRSDGPVEIRIGETSARKESSSSSHSPRGDSSSR